MVMRVGGLASGMDIDELVKKLMSAERAPLNKLQQKKQTYEWQRDAYRNVNTKLKTFDTYIADNLVLKTLNSKTASSSNFSLVSATATGSATGTITIEGVSQLAKSARGIGQQINADGNTKLSALLAQNGQTLPSEIKLSAIKKDGTMSEDVKIALDENMTVSQFVSKVNSSNAGVSAIFESGKLSITAKNTGDNKSGAEVKVNAGGNVFNALGFNVNGDAGDLANDGKNAVFQVNGIATERTTNTFSVNGYNITLNSAFNADKATAERYNAALLEWKNTHTTDYGNAIDNATARKNSTEAEYIVKQNAQASAKTNLYGDLVANDFAEFNKLGVELAEKVSKAGHTNTYKNTSYDTINSETAYNDLLTGAPLNTEQQFLKDNNVTYEQFNALRNLGEEKLSNGIKSSNFNTLGNNFFNDLTDKEKSLLQEIQTSSLTNTELESAITSWSNSTNPDSTQSDTEKALATKLANLSEVQKSALTRVLSDVTANNTPLDSYVSLANANKELEVSSVEKNKAETELERLETRKSAAEVDFKAAYKAQTAQELSVGTDVSALTDVTIPATSSSAITLSSTSNTDDMMAKIKEFVDTYNGLVKDLKNSTGETKYRDYTPLTAEQKEDMSESEIKLWEEKAKSGLLRNDALIQTGLTNMRSLVYQSNPAIENSKYNTLFSIGITTSKNYNEGGTLAIDEAKLRAAIEADPDAVEKLFKNSEGKKEDVVNGETVDTRGYLVKLRESMKNFEISIEKKAGRSTMTDGQYSIGKSLIDSEKRISTWQDKLKNIEARYWKQFTAMESAINKANSQSSIFAQG